MTATHFTAQQSADEFKNKSAMAFFATDSASNSMQADAAKMATGSLQAQLKTALEEQIKYMAQAAETEHATKFLAASRKIVAAMPEKTVANSSGLFSASARHTSVKNDATEEKTTTPGYTG